MVAQLASLPLRLRAKEVRAVLVMGGAVGIALLAMWATTPSAQRPAHIKGTILRLSASLESRYEPTQAVIEVELPDHRRTSLMTNYSTVARCKVGDRLALVSLRSLAGATMLEVEAPACR